MSLFRDFSIGHSKSQSNSHSNLSSALRSKWSPIGEGKTALQLSLEKMYWDGVKDELENIVRTLAVWQKPEFADVTVPDENDDFIHGFDTFLDQVCQETREFATRYGKKRQDAERNALKSGFSEPEYLDSLRNASEDHKAEYISSKLKSSVRQAIDDLPTFTGIEKRAWMLLLAAGFLDIEKLIEHRPKTTKVKGPIFPQLDFSATDPTNAYPMQCANPGCNDIIAGSMFTSRSEKEPRVVCEGCFFKHFYGRNSHVKQYKHCFLPQAITPQISRTICDCSHVPHFDGGKPIALFPVDMKLSHITLSGLGKKKCGLLKLDDVVAVAKYKGLQRTVGAKEAKSKSKNMGPLSTFQSRHLIKNHQPKKQSFSFRKPKSISNFRSTEQADWIDMVESPEADPDVPSFFRNHAEQQPFQNIHIALRVGPLVIENGLPHTKDGAVVSLRDMPVFHENSESTSRDKQCLVITGCENRKIWQHTRPTRNASGYKAIMKQVVGAPFTGVLGHINHEREFVHDIVAASKLLLNKEIDLVSTLNELLDKIKDIMGQRVNIYLSTITERLLDPKTCIMWSSINNTCQHFCNSLIDRSIFEPLLGPTNLVGLDSGPLYLMSFVCPDEGYMRQRVRTKFDVPSGLTQDYLSHLHFGQLDGADIIDMYQEYWYDWGGFNAPPYKYQDIFPWDCTEAYGRYPTCCGDCNLSKHVWAFPFDSWSMVSHHLTRDQQMYPPTSFSGDKDTTPQAWMRNRLNVVTASAILCRAASAMARTAVFRSSTAWLHSSSLSRVRLGGIHRAQPYSHFFEVWKGQDCFLAEWATWPPQDQLVAYEKLRKERIQLADVTWSNGNPFPAPPPLARGVNDTTSGFMDNNTYYTDSGFQYRDVVVAAGCAPVEATRFPVELLTPVRAMGLVVAVVVVVEVVEAVVAAVAEEAVAVGVAVGVVVEVVVVAVAVAEYLRTWKQPHRLWDFVDVYEVYIED